MTMYPPWHFVPCATLTKVTWPMASQVPIWRPSGEQTDLPGVQPGLPWAALLVLPGKGDGTGDLAGGGDGVAGWAGGLLADAEGTVVLVVPELPLPLWPLPALPLPELPLPELPEPELPEPELLFPLLPLPLLPVPELSLPEVTLDTAHEPTGFCEGKVGCFSTFGPALGKMTFPPSAVVQPFPMLATNRSGKEGARFEISGSCTTLADSTDVSSRFFDPATTVIGAQFMYISRLPIRLNQVHART